VSASRQQNASRRNQKLINRKRRIQYRLRERAWAPQDRPMFTASNIHYELADRVRGLGPGGIGAVHHLARRVGLIEAPDRRLHLLKVHLPYHESDHVLNVAYNILSGGTCLEDLELRRNDEVYLDALGAQRIAYRPTACQKTYTVVVLRKDLAVEQGQWRLFDDVRYFFYLTNLPDATPAEVVFLANDRCNQENLLEQLRNGVRALNMPVDGLVSNWAYMVMASLAWSLKAWWALLLPERGRWKEKHRREKQQVLTMEFKRFVNAFIRVPCQIVRAGRRIIYRLLGWNPWQHVFVRGLEGLGCPLRC